MSFFGWHISFKRLYFKSSRVEYQISLWRKVKYRRPEKLPVITGEEVTLSEDIKYDNKVRNSKDDK